MKILLLDAQNANTLAVARHLGKRKNIVIDLVYYHKFSITRYSKFVNGRFEFSNPKTDRNRFQTDLLKHLKNSKYDLVMPIGYASFEACGEIQEEIKNHSDIILPCVENLKLASNKPSTYKLAQDLGIPCPRTYFIKEIGELEPQELTFPIVLKSPSEEGINIVEYVYDINQTKHKFEKMKSRFNTPEKYPLVQEYIKGGGYGFFAYYESGKCKSYFMHKRIREYPVTGGASVCAESFIDDKLKFYGMKILDSLKWNGVAMVEFKLDEKDNEYKLMEINPKFWGSLELAIAAGVNFPEFLVNRALSKETKYPDQYDIIRFQWLLNGELFHFLERPKEIFNIIKDIWNSKNDISFSDIKPNLFQLIKIGEYIWKKIYK